MWWLDTRARRLIHSIRLVAVFAVAGLCAGCFQPMYGEHTAFGGGVSSIAPAMRGVEVIPIVTPRGTRIDRVGVEVRNNLIFALTGGSGMTSPTHRLITTMSSQQLQVIVDVTSGYTFTQNYGIDVTFQLIDLATGQRVINGQTFSRVSYNIPGGQQRFAGERGLRDAENRAAAVISDNIRNRLASYFTAGT